MNDVEHFIEMTSIPQREILSYFHRLFTSELELEAKIRYKIPFYYQKSWVCYLNPIKGHGVELAFLRGNELSNAGGLLQDEGRKQVTGFKCYSIADLPEEELLNVIHEALLLDETVKYASKRKTGNK